MACGREYQKNIKQPVRVVGVSLTIPKYKSGALKGMEHNTEEDPSDPMGVYGGGVGGGGCSRMGDTFETYHLLTGMHLCSVSSMTGNINLHKMNVSKTQSLRSAKEDKRHRE